MNGISIQKERENDNKMSIHIHTCEHIFQRITDLTVHWTSRILFFFSLPAIQTDRHIVRIIIIFFSFYCNWNDVWKAHETKIFVTISFLYFILIVVHCVCAFALAFPNNVNYIHFKCDREEQNLKELLWLRYQFKNEQNIWDDIDYRACAHELII